MAVQHCVRLRAYLGLIALGSEAIYTRQIKTDMVHAGILIAHPHYFVWNTIIDVIITILSVLQENNGVSVGVQYPKFDLFIVVTFFNNTNTSPNEGIIFADGRTSLTIKDSCVFSGNQQSSIQVFTTMVTLSGSNLMSLKTILPYKVVDIT